MPRQLYEVSNPVNRAMEALGKAGASYGSMMRKNEPPGKTAGGALQNAMGGTMAAASVGSMMAAPGAMGLAAVGGPVTLGIGAGVGLLAYLLS